MPPEYFDRHLSEMEHQAKVDWPQLKALGWDAALIMKQLVPAILKAYRERLAFDVQRDVGKRMGVLSLTEKPSKLADVGALRVVAPGIFGGVRFKQRVL